MRESEGAHGRPMQHLTLQADRLLTALASRTVMNCLHTSASGLVAQVSGDCPCRHRLCLERPESPYRDHDRWTSGLASWGRPAGRYTRKMPGIGPTPLRAADAARIGGAHSNPRHQGTRAGRCDVWTEPPGDATRCISAPDPGRSAETAQFCPTCHYSDAKCVLTPNGLTHGPSGSQRIKPASHKNFRLRHNIKK